MDLSVVVPLLDEQESVIALIQAVRAALEKDYAYELVLVDDGSTDATVEKVSSHQDPAVKLVSLNRNYGQSIAMLAGIDHAKADYIVTLDGDLQNDPKDIPRMMQMLHEQGVDVVVGARSKRQDNWFRTFPSWCANRLIVWMTGVNVKDAGCTLKVFRQDVAKNLGLFGTLHRFIPVLSKLYGARIVEMDVAHHPREHGESKYVSGLLNGVAGRTFAVLCDLLLLLYLQKFALKPMHLFGGVGLILLAFSLLVLFLHTWVGACMVAIFGVQCVFLGLIAEVLMRNYYHVENRRPYVVREVLTK